MRRRTAAPVASAFLTGFAGLSIWLAHISNITTPKWSLILLTGLLTGHLMIEIRRVSKVHNTRWLINPAVMCSILTFTLGYGLTNILYLLPDSQLALVGAQPDITHSMVNLMALVLLGAIAMWLAYWSPFAAGLGRKFQRSRFLDRLLKEDWDYRPDVILTLVLISLLSRLIAIRLGIFGFSSDADRLIETGGISQYISIGQSIGKLALLVVSLRYFSPTGRPLHVAFSFWALLGYEISFGFLSGFKSQVVMPLVIAGVGLYMRQGRLPLKWLVFVPVALMAAYAVIEPFRSARYEDKGFEGTSLAYIAKTMKAAYSGEGGVTSSVERPSIGLSILSRTNNLYMGSFGVEYADSGFIPAGAPNFLTDIFLSPIYAVLPRILFDFKPPGNLGEWYRIEVLGITWGHSSVAMGPFTYLYLSGGTIAVALGLFFIGVIQRSIADAFLASPKAGATIPFLIALPYLAVIDSNFYSIIVNLIRYLAIVLFMQRFIFRN